jgi:hypothetical protein
MKLYLRIEYDNSNSQWIGYVETQVIGNTLHTMSIFASGLKPATAQALLALEAIEKHPNIWVVFGTRQFNEAVRKCIKQGNHPSRFVMAFAELVKVDKIHLRFGGG